MPSLPSHAIRRPPSCCGSSPAEQRGGGATIAPGRASQDQFSNRVMGATNSVSMANRNTVNAT
jgi:hypothetical protein